MGQVWVELPRQVVLRVVVWVWCLLVLVGGLVVWAVGLLAWEEVECQCQVLDRLHLPEVRQA